MAFQCNDAISSDKNGFALDDAKTLKDHRLQETISFQRLGMTWSCTKVNKLRKKNGNAIKTIHVIGAYCLIQPEINNCFPESCTSCHQHDLYVHGEKRIMLNSECESVSAIGKKERN